MSKKSRKQIKEEFEIERKKISDQYDIDVENAKNDPELLKILQSTYYSELAALYLLKEERLMYGNCHECNRFTSTRTGATIGKDWYNDDYDYDLVLTCPKCSKH